MAYATPKLVNNHTLTREEFISVLFQSITVQIVADVDI